MIDLLQKYLKKIGAQSFTDLNAEEKETYKRWETALSGRRLTDEDVKTFLDTELEETLKKLTSQPLGDRQDIFLKMKLEFIRAVGNFLRVPLLEQEMTRRSIEGFLEKL